MYKTGDAVVYATYGVCIIKAIENRDFSGEDVEYYVLRPAGDERNTFYVPTSKGELREQMRPVLSGDEVRSLIAGMKDEELIWIDNEFMRRDEYRKILSGGDRRLIIRLIKTLYLRSRQLESEHKKLHSADERFFRDAENMLYDEFAYALDIPRDKVLSYITEHI